MLGMDDPAADKFIDRHPDGGTCRVCGAEMSYASLVNHVKIAHLDEVRKTLDRAR